MQDDYGEKQFSHIFHQLHQRREYVYRVVYRDNATFFIAFTTTSKFLKITSISNARFSTANQFIPHQTIVLRIEQRNEFVSLPCDKRGFPFACLIDNLYTIACGVFRSYF
jgi:hypothetical protein